MKITALMELGYSLEEVSDAVDLNPLRVAEHTLFDDKECDDYQNEAIDKVLELNVSFRATNNTLYEFVKRYVNVTCPKCGMTMVVFSGGGSGKQEYVNFRCENNNSCTSIIRLNFPSEGGIEYRPSYSDRR